MQSSYNVQAFKDTFERQFTYLNGFMRNVFRKADKPAMFCPLTDRVWTYQTLNEDANRLAHALRAHGVGRQDIIMHALLNSAEFVFTYLAAHKLGAVNAPISCRLSAGEMALLINASRPRVLIFDAEFTRVVTEALALAEHKPEAIVMTDLFNTETPPQGILAYRDIIRDMPATNPELDFIPGAYDETTRFFTSGTTNLPKGVPLNSLNEVLSAHDVLMHFPLNTADITMNLTPWFHRGGLHAGGPTPVLYAGGSLVILRDFAPRLALQYVSRYHVTFLIGVPTIVDMLCHLQETNPADISSLRGMVLMGAPLDKAACEKYMEKLTPNVFNGYGTTETFWNTFLRPADLPAKAGTAGSPCTDDDVRVVRLVTSGFADPSDMVPPDQETVGEVIILSMAKSSFSYFENPELTQEKFREGWLYTGDLATWDEHGYITIIGRKDDMIVSGGENIYPVQVEAILNEHPKVGESLVLGLPDARRGAIVVALIKAEDPSLTERELKQYCLRHPMLSPYKRPRMYQFVNELPHTATGKLLHKMPPDVTFTAPRRDQ